VSSVRVLKYPVKLVDKVVDRIIAVVGALFGSQGPGFIHHYVQNLHGRLAEAERNLETWKEVAHKASIESLQKLVDVYLKSDSIEVVEAGGKCAADIARVDQLRTAYESLTNASAWGRPFEFAKNIDSEIMESTFASFVPNVPLDVESLAYAVLGLVFAICLYIAGKRLVIVSARGVKGRLKRGVPKIVG